MTYTEIKEKLNSLGLTGKQMAWYADEGDFNDDEDNDYDVESGMTEDKFFEIFGDVVLVESAPCYDGHETHHVFWFEEHDIYVKYTGYYSSYNGSEWNNSPSHVYKKEKTIVYYDSKK